MSILIKNNLSSDDKEITFGIQGGRGSFTHQSLLKFLEKNKIKRVKIKYLYTSSSVLKELNKGGIEYGVLATKNSIGGVVEETKEAMKKYEFKVVEKFTLSIKHFLMKRKEVEMDKIKNVLAHPQVLKQCRLTLKKKEYKRLNFSSGEGELIDHSAVAKKLSTGEIDKNTALIGPEVLAKIYDLEIVARDLQDRKDNLTSFVLVIR